MYIFDIYEIYKYIKNIYIYNNHTQRKYQNFNIKYRLEVIYTLKNITLSHQIAKLQCGEN